MTNEKNHTAIVLLGPQEKKTSFAQVNQHLWKGLNKKYQMFTEFPNTWPKGLSNIIAIHHNPELDFANTIRPKDIDFYIAYRTWDFGKFPESWVDVITSEFDQLWVYSHWVKENAIKSKISSSKIKVVPPGVENIPKQFPKNSNEFNFIFIGATVYRKGIDVLLAAYSQAFTNQDKVTLIIKDNPSDVFYEQISFKDNILKFQNKFNNPKIHYVNEYLESSKLAELIQTATVGVFPYRSEGFARPILELMHIGIPSIVPDFGPCKDYCNEDTSYFVLGKNFSLPYSDEVVYNTLGHTVGIDAIDFYEISPEALAIKMQEVFSTDRTEIHKKGEGGQKITSSFFTWPKVIEKIENILDQLSG